MGFKIQSKSLKVHLFGQPVPRINESAYPLVYTPLQYARMHAGLLNCHMGEGWDHMGEV